MIDIERILKFFKQKGTGFGRISFTAPSNVVMPQDQTTTTYPSTSPTQQQIVGPFFNEVSVPEVGIDEEENKDQLQETLDKDEKKVEDEDKLDFEKFRTHRVVFTGDVVDRFLKKQADAADPSDWDLQKGPTEDTNETHVIDPESTFNKKEKGRGAPYGASGAGEGELKTNLPASIFPRTASDIVENFIKLREKEHLEEPEIRQELQDKGVQEVVVNDTYQNRDRNLIKTL